MADIKDFIDRKIYLFTNPVNQKTHIVLTETNFDNQKVFEQTFSGRKAEKVLEIENSRILYTSDDIIVQKGKPFGWVYGENKEIHKKNGEVVIKVNSCDFYGQKETLQLINTSLLDVHNKSICNSSDFVHESEGEFAL